MGYCCISNTIFILLQFTKIRMPIALFNYVQERCKLGTFIFFWPTRYFCTKSQTDFHRPSHQTLTPRPADQKRRIRSRTFSDFVVSNTIYRNQRVNDRCFAIPRAETKVYRYSFFFIYGQLLIRTSLKPPLF